jgi:hypothetical protein
MGQWSIEVGDELEDSSSTSTHITSNGTPDEVMSILESKPYFDNVLNCTIVHNIGGRHCNKVVETNIGDQKCI